MLYRIYVTGIRLIEAESPGEAVTQAALEASMTDTVASIICEHPLSLLRDETANMTRH